jgi:hypothetical protein
VRNVGGGHHARRTVQPKRIQLDQAGGFPQSCPIQLREDQLKGKRPRCPRGCPEMVHRHGTYARYADPEGAAQENIQRYLCRPCGRTFSVLPAHRLPYRPIRVARLQADFDQRAGIQTPGLDPPPRTVEAGGLHRAWSALTARVAILKDAFGQLVRSTVSDGASFWVNLRQSLDSAAKMLGFLSQHHRISLLANYRCLRPPA